MTCTKEDCNFEADFQITAKFSETCHAVCAYFDVEFSKGTNKKILLSTSPFSKYTHWRQSVFYLGNCLFRTTDIVIEKDVKMRKGEKIFGTLKVKQNEKNHRDLEIDLDVAFEGVFSKIDFSQHYKFR